MMHTEVFSFAPSPLLAAWQGGLAEAWRPSPAGTLLIGAVLGLLVFAFSYALRIVSARQTKQADGRSSGGAFWLRAGGAVLLVAGALSGLGLVVGDSSVHGTAKLRARDLFSVMPRAGLFPEFVGEDEAVGANDPVVRFLKVDDVAEEIRRLEERRRRLENEIALLEVRPLVLDAVIMAEFQSAELAMSRLDDQARNLADEQAVLARELAGRKLERDQRALAIEKELRALDTDIEKLRTRMGAADEAMTSARAMLEEGLISRRELNDREHELVSLRNALQGLRDQRYMLEVEAADLDSLYDSSESSYEVQLALRADAVEGSDERKASVIAAYRDASLAIEQERGRAAQVRAHELDKLRAELVDCERRLEDPLGAAVVSAPWAGRIGYRDPSPMSRLPGQGPLLVMYRPGTIWAEVPCSHDAGITPAAECRVTWTSPETGRRFEMPGRVLAGPELIETEYRVRVACEPPAEAVESLAMAQPVHVSVSVVPDIKGDVTARTGAALLMIPTGLAMLLMRPRQRRNENEDRPRFRARPDGNARQDGSARPDAAARPAARRTRGTGRRRYSRRDVVPAAAHAAAASGAMEFRPSQRTAQSGADERLLAWLPSAIRAHDLPRQVMSRLITLQPGEGEPSPDWAEVTHADIRAAVLTYVSRAVATELDVRSARRLGLELAAYCDLVADLTDSDLDHLKAELEATLNGALLIKGVDESDRRAALGGLRAGEAQA